MARQESSGPAFVVFTSDDKTGTLYPDIIGPFESTEVAVAWIDRHPSSLGNGVIEPIDGGYAGAIVVSTETVDRSPEQEEEMWEESAYGDEW